MSKKHSFFNVIKTLVVSGALLATSVHAAPTLIYESGALTGVTGIMIKGKSFDVDFLEGSCQSAMDPCQGNSFFFKNQTDAFAATSALAQQVFSGEDPNGVVPGCDAIEDCWFFTPYVETDDEVYGVAFHNAVEMPDEIDYLSVETEMDYANVTFARWGETVRIPAEVPEPGSIALLSIAMAGLGFARRKR